MDIDEQPMPCPVAGLHWHLKKATVDLSFYDDSLLVYHEALAFLRSFPLLAKSDKHTKYLILMQIGFLYVQIKRGMEQEPLEDGSHAPEEEVIWHCSPYSHIHLEEWTDAIRAHAAAIVAALDECARNHDSGKCFNAAFDQVTEELPPGKGKENDQSGDKGGPRDVECDNEDEIQRSSPAPQQPAVPTELDNAQTGTDPSASEPAEPVPAPAPLPESAGSTLDIGADQTVGGPTADDQTSSVQPLSNPPPKTIKGKRPRKTVLVASTARQTR